MNTFSLTSKTIFALFLSLAVLSTGCQNPASSDDDHNEHEHTEPVGLQIIINGETVIEYFEGEVTGQLTLEEGKETPLTLEFLNEEREHIHDEDLGDEYSLGWDIGDDNVLGIEQHDEDGRWSFHLTGKSAGTSRIQFQLLHGEHADFETPAVEQENALEIQVQSPSE